MTKQKFTIKSNRKSSINKSNPRYAHLSDDSIEFLTYCEEHGVNPIQRHINQSSAEFKTYPFQNGNPENPDYFCVRFLASYANREVMGSWSIYEIKDGGFLISINDLGPPAIMSYHLVYTSLSEIEANSIAPRDLLIDAQSALKSLHSQSMIGLPTQEQPITPIKPKRRNGKLKTEAELTALSDAMLGNTQTDSVLKHLKPLNGRNRSWVYSPDCW